MTIEEKLDKIEKLIMLHVKDPLCVEDVAIMLDVTVSRVRHLVSEREITCYKCGRRVYFKKKDVESYIYKNKNKQQSISDIDAKASTYLATN